MESWDEFSAPHDTSTTRVSEERQIGKKKRNHWWSEANSCTTSVRGGYVAMHEIKLDGAERKICRDCVDKLWMGGKPKKLKMVQHRTVYRTDELE